MGHPMHRPPYAVPTEITYILEDGREVKVTRVGLQDRKELAKIYSEVYSPMEGNWEIETAERHLEELSGIPHSGSLVARVDGKMVGATFCHREHRRDGLTLVGDELFVESEWQHTGIGTILMHTSLKQTGLLYEAKIMELVTFAEEGHAREFYYRLGLKDTEPKLVIMNGPLEGVVTKLRSRLEGSNAKG